MMRRHGAESISQAVQKERKKRMNERLDVVVVRQAVIMKKDLGGKYVIAHDMQQQDAGSLVTQTYTSETKDHTTGEKRRKTTDSGLESRRKSVN